MRILTVLLSILVTSGCAGPSGPASPASATGAEEAEHRTDSTPSPSEDGDGSGRDPTEEERAAFAELEELTERIRELEFEHPVPVGIQDQVRISAQLSSMIEEEDLDEARVVYGALGLIEPDVNLRELIERLASEQVVGYYDPDDNRLVVRDDVMSRRGGDVDEASAVLVHELVHALQDQQLDLGDRFDLDRDTDAENAFDALVEGDATLAMLGHVLAEQGAPLDLITRQPALLGQVLSQTPLQGMELEAAPPIVRVTLLAPYLKGLLFVAHLHGQDGWRAVNEAHAELPASSEQVLHPEKYLAGEAPEEVPLPELPELAAAGLEPMEEDTLGELELGVYLAQHRPKVDADEAAAAGWAGDRLRVYQSRTGPGAVVWFTLWDDEDEAEEALQAARGVREAVPADRRDRHRVERRGRAVLILRGLPKELHPPVRKAFRAFAESV
ncbi:MAG: hypothetical protein ACOCXM_03120 [Myxococcota bacterium]